jgi:uncharacterized membrane protein
MWKTAHIVSAAVLFGAGIGIAFFCWFGYRETMRTGDISPLRVVLRLTVIADACFIAPAVLFQVVSGVILMNTFGWPLISAWSLVVFGLFIFIGMCWIPVIIIQVLLWREMKFVSSAQGLPIQFHRRFRWWLTLGLFAFTAIIVIVYLMVAKPLSVVGI